MKHLVTLTTQRPAEAELWQELVCTFAVALQALLGAAGGGFPVADFVVEKCDLPVAE